MNRCQSHSHFHLSFLLLLLSTLCLGECFKLEEHIFTIPYVLTVSSRVCVCAMQWFLHLICAHIFIVKSIASLVKCMLPCLTLTINFKSACVSHFFVCHATRTIRCEYFFFIFIRSRRHISHFRFLSLFSWEVCSAFFRAYICIFARVQIVSMWLFALHLKEKKEVTRGV